MRASRALSTLLMLSLLVAVPSYAGKKKAGKKHNTKKTATLFNQLGGMKGINTVVNDFVGRAASDEKIKDFFAKTASNPNRLKKFKKNLADQICQAAGGPCKYRGKDMKTAHAGMGITDEHFDALVADLSAALDKAKVKGPAKTQLLSALGPMKGDIVSGERTISSSPEGIPENAAPTTENPEMPAPEAN